MSEIPGGLHWDGTLESRQTVIATRPWPERDGDDLRLTKIRNLLVRLSANCERVFQ